MISTDEQLTGTPSNRSYSESLLLASWFSRYSSLSLIDRLRLSSYIPTLPAMPESRGAGAIAEDVFVGISHSVPIVGWFWGAGQTRLSKDKIRELLEEGKTELHHASQVLADPTCEALLSAQLFNRLREDYRTLHMAGMKHGESLRVLKWRQPYKKYKVWKLVAKWTEDSRTHKYNVWTASDWAKVCKGLQEWQDSDEGGHTTVVDNLSSDEGATPSTRVLTLIGGSTLTVHIEEDTSHEGDTETTDITDARPSDMDSIFGNPFLGYTVEFELPVDDKSNDSD
ncbi:hypothetical protein C2E23DRAFT_905072 [Lenzites betulinus]|nr:hypothetical protein C2E23DRAFT_905072 [Lenzites betulinus]